MQDAEIVVKIHCTVLPSAGSLVSIVKAECGFVQDTFAIVPLRVIVLE
jgi:hypothetical protein